MPKSLSDAESLLAAAKFLEKSGRQSSVLPLTQLAMDLAGSRPIVEKVFAAAQGEGNVAVAMRALVNLEHFAIAEGEGLSNVHEKFASFCRSVCAEDFVNAPSAFADHSPPPINSKDSFLLGFLSPANGLEELDVVLEACESLLREGIDLKLVVFGGSKQSVLSRRHDAVRTDSLHRSANFVLDFGGVSIDQLSSYYRRMDAIVVPHDPSFSRTETPSMKVVEGLLYRRPLIVYESRANNPIAERFDHLTLYQPRDSESLARSIHESISTDKAPDPYAIAQEIQALLASWQSPNLVPLNAIVGFETRDSYGDISWLISQVKRLAKPSFTHRAEFVRGRVAIVASEFGDAFSAIDPHCKRLALEGHDLTLVHPAGGRQALPANGESFYSILETDDIDWLGRQKPGDRIEHLQAAIKGYTKLFREALPEVVVTWGDFRSALPAIIAAKALGLPVIKRHLHYADHFARSKDEQSQRAFGFGDEYRLEQLCFQFADQLLYFDSGDPDGSASLSRAVHHACSSRVSGGAIKLLETRELFSFDYQPTCSGPHCLQLEIVDANGGSPKGAIANFRFLDDRREIIAGPSDFRSSDEFPCYKYVDTSGNDGNLQLLVFEMPAGIASVEVEVVPLKWHSRVRVYRADIAPFGRQWISQWVGAAAPAKDWLDRAIAFSTAEGALSLRLALLNKKYKYTKHPNDRREIDRAVEELVELEPSWLPEINAGFFGANRADPNNFKVLHLHKTAYPYENSGGAIRCLNTVLSQKRIGIEPYIVTPAGYPHTAGVLGVRDYERIKDIEHFRFGADTGGISTLSNPDQVQIAAFNIAKLVQLHGASVIHAASGVRGYELAVEALAVREITGVPVLYEVRSFHEHTWSPVRSDALRLEKTKLRAIKEDFCMAEADFVTTISQSMRKILVERGVPPEKIAVVPNAIDEEKYRGQPNGAFRHDKLHEAEAVIGYISNMSKREGHDILLKAIKEVRAETGRDIRGLLVGDGPERERLETLALELELAEVITFTGSVDHGEINSYYNAIDIFVVPRIPDYASDWVTPLKPYEAMALERPVIVTDLPALKEIVGENEERGLIAKPNDATNLALQIRRYLEAPELRRSKIKAAREWVFSERTWSANAQRYDRIYRRMIASASHKSTADEKGAQHA